MTAKVIQIRDYLPVFGPPLCLDAPAAVIIMPVVRIERAAGVKRGRKAPPPAECLPSDCEP